jgi:hypothetical protein
MALASYLVQRGPDQEAAGKGTDNPVEYRITLLLSEHRENGPGQPGLSEDEDEAAGRGPTQGATAAFVPRVFLQGHVERLPDIPASCQVQVAFHPLRPDPTSKDSQWAK